MVERAITPTLRTVSRLRHSTLLIIEPNDIAREQYRSALKPLGCSLIQAANGVSGLAVARSFVPDLVITELMLPDIAGADILAAFDGDAKLRSIPIIASSSASALDQLAPAVAVEFADCLLKPIDAPRLRAVVSRILEQGFTLRAAQH